MLLYTNIDVQNSGAERYYRFVKITEVKLASSTILATEMTDNAAAVSYGVIGSGWIMSHRPVSGFAGVSGELDLYLVPAGQGIRQVTRDDLDADPDTVGNATRTRLDLVGRNHGKRGGYPDRRLSNFFFSWTGTWKPNPSTIRCSRLNGDSVAIRW